MTVLSDRISALEELLTTEHSQDVWIRYAQELATLKAAASDGSEAAGGGGNAGSSTFIGEVSSAAITANLLPGD
jgi:hypothetical protein